MARPARVKRRHWGMFLSFFLIVLAPVAAGVWYLQTRAVDQYASTLAFTVRSEDVTTASDLLGGIGAAFGGSGGSRDSDILFAFIRSQQLVAEIDASLDLRSLYSRHHEIDPLFSFNPDGTIEDLTTYWQRMVRISYDSSSGLMELQVLAFDPAEAREIARSIYERSTTMINGLSAIARNDATRYASEDLLRAQERLATAREALTAFRVENQIVDVTADIQSQMGILATLQTQLANALIDLDMLRNTAGESDPRVVQAQARIGVIEARIEEERQKFAGSGGGPGGNGYAATVADFERLNVEREFAERAYIAALQAFDGARAEAQRQSRYLAAFIEPTLAERAQYPQRPLITGLIALFSFLGWAVLCLVYYALRDRR